MVQHDCPIQGMAWLCLQAPRIAGLAAAPFRAAARTSGGSSKLISAAAALMTECRWLSAACQQTTVRVLQSSAVSVSLVIQARDTAVC